MESFSRDEDVADAAIVVKKKIFLEKTFSKNGKNPERMYMDFSFAPEQAAFRQELGARLAANALTDTQHRRQLQPQAPAAELAFLKSEREGI